MNISSLFIHRPVMTTFVMLTIILAGWLAFIKLPVSDLPSIQHPQIVVSAGFPGASPETVLNQITVPMEKELTHVKGIQEMSSVSSPGFSTITLSFDLSKDMDDVVRDVQAALRRVEPTLPRDTSPRPSYQLHENSQEPIMYLMLTSNESSVAELRTYADAYILPRLSRLEGVAQVMAFGSAKSVWIRLNPELMAVRQVGFNEVIEAVKQQTTQMPLGTIQTSSKKLAIELSGNIHEAKELENVKIGKHGIRLKDIGEVSEKSNQEQEFHYVTHEGTSLALILGIQKVNDANTVSISKAVRGVMDTLQKELPSSIHLSMWFDKAVWINESIFDVQWSLLLAFVLVFLVIYFSLGRFSESLITGVAILVSLIGTFAVMYSLDFTIDLLSLLALTLSVGFVVDDAIVVLENIVRHHEKGASAREASLKGSKQIGFTIVSMTLSLVAVFIPLLFMPGINGRLFREFSVTLAAAILVSGFISLSLTPMLCSRFLSAHTGQTKLQQWIAKANASMVELYGSTLKRSFNYSKTIGFTALACMAASVFLFSKLPVNLVPPEDRGFLFAFVNLPAGLEPKQVAAQQKMLESIVEKNMDIKNFMGINFNNNLLFIIRLQPLGHRPPQAVIMADLQKSLDAIPGIQTFIQAYQLINLNLEFGHAGQYALVVQGLHHEDVAKGAQALTQALQADPEFTFVQNSLKNDSPMLAMTIDEELAHQYGFGKQHIMGLLQSAYGQMSVGKIQKGTDQEKIFMELLPQYQNHTGAPAKLYLTTPDGRFVPLRAVAEWHEKLGSPDLTRREQLPSATLRFSLADGIAANVGLERAEKIAQDVLPDNVSGVLTGSAKAIASTINDLLLLLLAAAVIMYIVLGILYESFVHPLTILSSLPFAGLGGILTLFLFSEPISIFSAVGFLLLIGIVKKNGIMMVDYALDARKRGMTPKDAIYEACLVRFRPIMMTTVAAVMGAVPIAIGFGDGAEMRRGLGLVIVGGLIFAQFLTLYVTPILYLAFDGAKEGRFTVWSFVRTALTKASASVKGRFTTRFSN